MIQKERREGDWADTREIIEDMIEGLAPEKARWFLIGFRYGLKRAGDLLGTPASPERF